MSHSELAIAGLYDHEQDTERRAPDWGGDELFTAVPGRRFERVAPSVQHFKPPRPREAVLPPRPVAPVAPAPAGRRSVTVTGRPGEAALTLRPRRPGRSLDERFAARPERIAAWAVGLGFLLILIAIATAPS